MYAYFKTYIIKIDGKTALGAFRKKYRFTKVNETDTLERITYICGAHGHIEYNHPIIIN